MAIKRREFFNTILAFRLCLLLVILLAIFEVATFMTEGRSNLNPALWSEAVSAAQVSDIVDKKLKLQFKHIEILDQKLKYALTKDLISIADEQFQRFQEVVDKNMKPVLTELQRFGKINESAQDHVHASQPENDIPTKQDCGDSEGLPTDSDVWRSAFLSWQSRIRESQWATGPDGGYIIVTPTIELPELIQRIKREECFSCQCSFINECLLPANCDIETTERTLAFRHIHENATVLEVGARYGSVSCFISSILRGSGKLVSVEPDPSVWEILERNKQNMQCDFHIAKGMLSKKAGMIHKQAYATHTIVEETDFQTGWKESGNDGIPVPSFSLSDLQREHNLVFDVANFDCEGCFPYVVEDFPELLKQANLLIVELHNPKEEELLVKLAQEGEWQPIDFIHNIKVLRRDTDAGLRPIRKEQPIKWSLQRRCKISCTRSCRQQNMSCDDAAYRNLSSESAVQSAFEVAKIQCPAFEDLNVDDPFWDGPWFNSGSKVCGYSSHERTGTYCSIRNYNCDFNRLCPCFSK